MNKKIKEIFPSATYKRILKLILTTNGISRADIARTLKLSRARITEIVKNLFKNSIVVKKAIGSSKIVGGKRPIILGVNKDKIFIIAINISGINISESKITGYLIDLEGNIRSKKIKNFNSDILTPDKISNLLIDLIKYFEKTIKKQNNAFILATGIVISGVINSSKGTILSSIIPKIRDYPLKKVIEEQTQIPTFIENPHVISAIYEHWYGVAKRVNNFVFLQVLPFIKAVPFINGKVYYGKNFIAGEIGASLAKIGNEKQEYLCDLIDNEIFGMPKISSKISENNTLLQSNYLSIRKFIQNLKNNEGIASYVELLSKILGQVVLNIILFYDPELIVFGGVPKQYQPKFLEGVKCELKKFIYFPKPENIFLTFEEEKKSTTFNSKGILCMVLERF